MGCQEKKSFETPEVLATAYIDFINNGLNYSDYVALLSTPEEAHSFGFIDNPGGLEKAEEYKQKTLQYLIRIDKEWESIKEIEMNRLNEFQQWNHLQPPPYNYQYMDTKYKSENFYKNNKIIAVDGLGNQVIFKIKYLYRVNNNWKILLPDGDIIEMSN